MSRVALSRLHILRLALIIEMIVLFANAAAISRDYQDSWILEGLEIPFVAFVTTYIIYIFIETDIKWIIPFTVIFRVVIGVLPNLKYVWFQGVWPDQHSAYRLSQDIYDSNHIPTGMYYSDTPHMHLLFAILSKETGLSILLSFKYCPILMWSIYPLVVYMILKNCGKTNKTSLLKYALIFSSIPITASTSYVVSGSLIGLLISLLLLSEFMKLFRMKDRRDLIILAIFSFVLVSAHSYSATILIVMLFAVYVILRLLRGFLPNNLTPLQLKYLFETSLMIGLLNLAWLLHKAGYMLNLMVGFLHGYIGRALGAQVLLDQPVSPRLFELLRIDFVEGLKVILVWHGATLFVIFLALIGLLLVAKEIREQPKSFMFLIIYVISLLVFLILGLTLRISSGWAERIVRQLVVISPIFCSIPLVYINKKIRKFTVFIILILMVLATAQFYGCQPLVPSASLINKELPAGAPIGYRVEVNSIYQRDMIDYIERYTPQNKRVRIACDRVTHYQIMGLTSWNFSTSHLAWYYPLDKSVPERKYDYFLIHLPGKSGRFSEQVEIRIPSLILQVICNSSILYSNGESYVLKDR